MEMEGQPPSLNPVSAEGTPPIPPAEAEVVLPPEAVTETEAPAPEPPSEYSDEEYGQFLQAQGLGEFAGNPMALQGVRAFDRDYNVYLNAHEAMVAALPPGTRINPPAPLAGDALERAISTLTERYFPTASPSQRQMARPLLETAAQRTHQLTATLSAGDRTRARVQATQEAKLEAVALQKTRQEVGQMSADAYSLAYTKAWNAWKAADDVGDTLGKKVHNAEMDRLMKARYAKD